MENQKTIQQTDEMEIDLLELLAALRRKLWLILLAAVIGGGIAGAFSKFVLTPQYTSTAMMYILSQETTLTSLADLQIGSQLTKDYEVIVRSRPILEDVIQNLGLNMSHQDLEKKISINNPTDTRILSISVTDPDPVMAKTIVDEVANASSEYIGDIMEMIPPKMIEDGEVPQQKSSPSNSRNAMLGAMLGIVLVCGITVLGVVLNDTIQTEEDIEKYLGISVLALVPEREGEMTVEDKDEMASAAAEHGRSRKKRKGKN